MPEISRFFGIQIFMRFLDSKQHSAPHLHARYAGEEAVFGLPEGDLLAGSLPRRQRRLVEAWIEIHQEELLANWERADAGEPVRPIEPLR